MPVFLVKGFKLTPKGNDGFYKHMGDGRHLKLFGRYFDAMLFSMADQYHDLGDPKSIDMVGTLSRNYFMHKSADQFEVIDMKKCAEDSRMPLLSKLIAERMAAGRTA